MWSPFNRLKFAFNADNQQQVDAGVTSMIGKGKKDFCIEYQDTDYGKDILAGLQDALKENNLPLVAKETHKPADTDLGTQILNLRNAKCSVVVLGMLIRDGSSPIRRRGGPAGTTSSSWAPRRCTTPLSQPSLITPPRACTL